MKQCDGIFWGNSRNMLRSRALPDTLKEAGEVSRLPAQLQVNKTSSFFEDIIFIDKQRHLVV